MNEEDEGVGAMPLKRKVSASWGFEQMGGTGFEPVTSTV
jgi:hypothetical protein